MSWQCRGTLPGPSAFPIRDHVIRWNAAAIIPTAIVSALAVTLIISDSANPWLVRLIVPCHVLPLLILSALFQHRLTTAFRAD